MSLIHCPKCNKTYQVDQKIIGQKARCFSCGTVFVAEEYLEEDVVDLKPQDATIPEQINASNYSFTNILLAEGVELQSKKMLLLGLISICFIGLIILVINAVYPISITIWPVLPIAAYIFIKKRTADRKQWEKTKSRAQNDLDLFYKSRELAEKGNFFAQNQVGVCYALGKGTSKNCNEAVRWFKKADREGSYNAHCNLGWCYYYGEGVTKNYSKAVSFFKYSSRIPEAQYNLGVCFFNGNGVSKNNADALKWWRRSAEQGCAKAQDTLKKLDSKE